MYNLISVYFIYSKIYSLQCNFNATGCLNIKVALKTPYFNVYEVYINTIGYLNVVL
jgi:hypothetical protein